MKKKLKYIIAIALPIMFIAIFILQAVRYDNLESKYITEKSNSKAYYEYINDLQGENFVLQYTVDEFEYMNDSISNRLKKTQDSLKIKSKQIVSLQAMNSQFAKKDTIIINDTIFKDSTISIDTMIGDKYLSNHLVMSYPNNIHLETKVLSEKDVIITQKKTTVDPPKKFFLCRWFQKKHYVIEAIINEYNPYVINHEEVFIKIIE